MSECQHNNDPLPYTIEVVTDSSVPFGDEPGQAIRLALVSPLINSRMVTEPGRIELPYWGKLKDRFFRVQFDPLAFLIVDSFLRYQQAMKDALEPLLSETLMREYRTDADGDAVRDHMRLRGLVVTTANPCQVANNPDTMQALKEEVVLDISHRTKGRLSQLVAAFVEGRLAEFG